MQTKAETIILNLKENSKFDTGVEGRSKSAERILYKEDCSIYEYLNWAPFVDSSSIFGIFLPYLEKGNHTIL
jgi:hypothetical protein